MADVFEALAAPARRTILDELQDRNGQTLYELCTRLTMRHGLSLTRQAISQHLDVLESAGLVSSRRQGRCKLLYINTGPLKTIAQRWPPSRQKGSRR
jgi:DNA-binding transcriptional ArsR family regulator